MQNFQKMGKESRISHPRKMDIPILHREKHQPAKLFSYKKCRYSLPNNLPPRDKPQKNLSNRHTHNLSSKELEVTNTFLGKREHQVFTEMPFSVTTTLISTILQLRSSLSLPHSHPCRFSPQHLSSPECGILFTYVVCYLLLSH